ncbi:MAG: ATP-dependent Clp protease ATP-binding subunit [Treponema sp.]|nr:ATP-dependent Clp protease ATP-binding subunit [Treponema sp.]
MKGLSNLAQKLLTALAQEEGRKSGSLELLPEHVILALLKSAEGFGYQLLKVLNINVLSFQLVLEQSISPRENLSEFSELPPSRRLRTLLDTAVIESRSMRADYVGTEHLLIAAIREENSVTRRFFDKTTLDIDFIRTKATEILANSGFTSEDKTEQNNANQKPRELVDSNGQSVQKDANKQKKTFLSEFSRDLTQLYREGKLDPVVGRDNEIKRVIQILSRRTKNNPILVGEPGVGKTAVAEGLAEHIAKGDVPFNLSKKTVVSLDLTAIVAGTRYRGDFEERMKRMMKEVIEAGNIILFIDEIHTMIGAGNSEGGMDAGNILKPALSRGEIQVIGATTFGEFRKKFERDPALERRFQKVAVEEPSEEATIEILEGLKKQYEEFHSVTYDTGVTEAIVKLSRRYIPERFLPDKAIDIMDEAGSAKKIVSDARPVELSELERDIEKLNDEKNLLVENQDYERAAQVRDKVHELKTKLDEFNEYWKNNASSSKKHVTVSDIEKIVADITGIPSNQISMDESARLLDMEQEIHKEVIGQNEAVKILSGTIRRSRAGVSSPNRPIGSFIFLGPTGVGKTKLAKSLAKFLFGSEEAILRVDMSDFMEKHTASRLVGAPPGYVGFEEGGSLTEKARQKPYSVILFDEIEKAHPDVFNILLQLFEEGELRDNLGHTVNFRNAVIIMTSNAGARQITADKKLGFASMSNGILPKEEIKANAMEELKKIMNPELINRIDDIIVFDPLSRDEVSQILDIQIHELEERLSEKSLSLSIKPAAREYLLDNGYDPSMGARPLRRIIQDEIEDQLASLILSGKCTSGKVYVDLNDGKLVVKASRTRKPKKEMEISEG